MSQPPPFPQHLLARLVPTAKIQWLEMTRGEFLACHPGSTGSAHGFAFTVAARRELRSSQFNVHYQIGFAGEPVPG